MQIERKILLIVNDPGQESLFIKALNDIDPKARLDRAENAERAMKKIARAHQRQEKRPYDLIALSVCLDGKITGMDFLEISQNVFPKIPTIILERPLRLADCKLQINEVLTSKGVQDEFQEKYAAERETTTGENTMVCHG